MFVHLLFFFIAACFGSADSDDHVALLQLPSSLHLTASTARSAVGSPFALFANDAVLHHDRDDPLGQACDAQNSCHGTCFVDVYNGESAVQFKMDVAEHDAYVSREAMCKGSVWELVHVNEVLEVLRRTHNGNFLDIGANIGSYSLTVASWMQKDKDAASIGRKIVAVEASQDTANMLQASVDVNAFSNIVNVHQIAMVNDPSKHSLCLNGGALNGSSTNLGGAQADLGDRTFESCEQEVPAATLDSLYASEPALKSVVVAKLDCEGCEGQSLLGARQFLRESPPCVLVMEVTEKYLCEAGTPLNDIKVLLDEMGYEPLQSETHGDGTCAGYEAWEKQNGGMSEQILEFVKQKDFDACMQRFS